MSRITLALSVLCGSGLIIICACEDNGPSGGFTVTTSEGITDPVFGITINSPVSGIQVIGNYIRLIKNAGTPEGYVLNFTQYSTAGSLFVTAWKNPAWWNLAESNGPCGGQSVNAAIIQPQRVANLVCVESSLSSAKVNPESFDGANSPQIQLTTQTPMSFTYGPPRLTISSGAGVVFYDQTPNAYTSTTLTVYSGSVPALYDDTYYIMAGQKLEDGSMGLAGYTTISTFGNPYKACVRQCKYGCADGLCPTGWAPECASDGYPICVRP
jgi:hypothetical protein